MILFGRGDLHLGVLLERMRRYIFLWLIFNNYRDGFEMLISPPEVVTKLINDTLSEPYERVTIESSPDYANLIIEKMNNRKADYLDC